MHITGETEMWDCFTTKMYIWPVVHLPVQYEVGLIYDEDTTPPCQHDLARDGPRGTN